MRWTGLINHYREYLPVSEKTPVITLYEGNTPLIPAEFLNKITGLQVFLKYEGLNPTGSFKDRGMTMAISKACEKGRRDRHVRLHGQYISLCSGLCRPCRDQMCGAYSQWQYCHGQIGPSHDPSSAGDRHRR